MKRRAFGGVMLAIALGVGGRAGAQSDATSVQIDLVRAAASLAALRSRYGETYPDVVDARARVEALQASLAAARARHEAIDLPRVTQTIEGELADVQARLGEFSSRCGSGHPDLQTAHARALVLQDALAHLTSDGFYPG